jgi:hypothetical protein
LLDLRLMRRPICYRTVLSALGPDPTPTMATLLPIDPDTITVMLATSGVAPSDLAVALTTVQATAAASYERDVVIESAS